ncbi:MAG: hypothetical protein AAGL29_05655 [Bacteroidota bacterium]
MKNKTSFFLFLFPLAFWSSSMHGQEEKRFFLDENDFVISETVFENKKKSSIYFSERLYSEKGPVERLRFMTYMGIMDSTLHKQMNQLLSSRIQANTTKTFFVRYVDSVATQEQMRKSEYTRQTPYGPKNYGNRWRSFVLSTKGQNRYNSNQVEVLHLYGHIQKEDKRISELGWRKDPSNVFKHLFMTLGRPKSAFVAIHPDGRFWLRHLCLTDVSIKQMINPKTWEKRIIAFQKEYERLNPNNQ